MWREEEELKSLDGEAASEELKLKLMWTEEELMSSELVVASLEKQWDLVREALERSEDKRLLYSLAFRFRGNDFRFRVFKELMDHPENDGDDSPSEKRKGRGRTILPKLIKLKSSGEKLVIVFNSKGQPIGQTHTDLGSYIGVLAKTMIPISCKTWKKVDKEFKDKLWNCVEMSFEVDRNFKKKVVQTAGKRWRAFKTTLTGKFVIPERDSLEGLKHPPEIYNFIEPCHWETFLKSRLTKEFMILREKQQERQSNNKYPSRISRKEYAELAEELKRSSGKDEDPDRSILWVEARKRADKFVDESVDAYAVKIQKLANDIATGTVSSDGTNDILTMALETPERSGRVRGVGQYVTQSTYFHMPRGQNVAGVKALIAERERKFNEHTKRMEEAIARLKSELDAKAVIGQPTGKSCMLAVGANDNIVAHGTIMASDDPFDTIHGIPISDENVRVSIDVAIKPSALLPFSVCDELLTVGEAVGSYVAWPKNLIIL
ncbi:hypothetical protein LWI28_022076 [Acer negundo]|uniref:DUF8039 domain-containing protein n=1 Tax=Acer negundo TaxID=4023 RepID=A0AAD5P2M1_ACENE|nr:hypothetical protein LWI28_022076 [Acer negundo]